MKRLSFLLATSILSTMSAQAFAAAPKEPGLSFHPAKSWVVGKASEDSKECAVQSEFNNGFVLQFDGADKNVNSFTINFRQNIFNEGQNYTVGLGVPGKTKKTISATATGPSMLTVPMNGNKDVYDAARKDGVIDVNVEDNAFRFYLVNFAPAATNFERCIGGEPMQNAPQPAVAPAAQQQPAPLKQADAAPVPQEPKAASAPTAVQPVQSERLAQPSIATQRERTQMTASSEIAPPPPNAFKVDQTATINESIAFEQNEKSGKPAAVIEISPDNPQPVAQTIPYTEKVTLGDQVIVEKVQNNKATPMNVASANAAPAPTPAPAVKMAPPSPSEDKSAESMNAAVLEGRSVVPTGKFVSVTPAAPTTIVPLNQTMPDGTVLPTMSPPVAQPAAQQQAAVNMPTDVAATASQRPAYRKRMSEMLDQEIRNNPTIASADDNAPRNVSNNLASPAAPADTIDVTQENLIPPAAPAPLAAPAPMAVAPTVEEMPSIPPLDPSRKPLAMPPAAPMKPAPISAPAAAAMQKSQMQAAMATEQVEALPMPPASDEPFAKPGEKINADEFAARKHAGATAEIKLPPIAEPMPEVKPAPVTKRVSTPEMTVHKNTQRVEADFTGLDTVEPSSAEPFQQFAKNDTSRIGDMKADPEMLHKISELEKEVNKLRTQNESLNSELGTTLKGAEDERMSIASENWNLERATMRYNEAERQIKRLGEQLAKERAMCSGEKKDIEAQLFDPRITDQQQLAKLAELESKLSEAQQQLDEQRTRYEERIRMMQANKATQ